MKNDIEITFDNDASASSFGWNFQVNAGIFLLLYYIQDAKQIKIESKYEDIEIQLSDNKKIYAQAKSAQNECTSSNAKEKIKDAFMSLAKVPVTEKDKLVYISNLREPIKNGGRFFENSVISYSECLESMKKTINDILGEIVQKLDEKKKKETNSEKINKYEHLKQKVISINIEQIEICTIYPYYGEERNRYRQIKDKIIDTLSSYFQLNHDDVICISQKLMEHWQLTFEHNSTIKDGSLKKIISKEEFLWPIVAFLSDNDGFRIDDCMSFIVDSSLKQEAIEYMNSTIYVYHERFQFVNAVLRDYAKFKNAFIRQNEESVEKSYIKKEYKKFVDEFAEIEDLELREYVLKNSMYKIIMNNRKIQKISKEANV